MRTLRKIVDLGLPVVGILIVFCGVLFAIELYTQLILVTIGILIIEVSIWKLTNPLLPSERRFIALRREVDAFIPLTRELNRAAIAIRANEVGAAARFDDARQALHDAVDRMVAAAGVEGDVITASDPAFH